MADTTTGEPTKAELYEQAKEQDIQGRSTMSRGELERALAERGATEQLPGPESGDPEPGTVSRYQAFEALARARAAGAVVLLPRQLTGEARRQHVRQTIREDHAQRIKLQSEDAQAKFDKLDGSLYSFFRGTCLLFYRDLAGEDAWMPTVLALGDVHPENYGVMPSADNVPIFGVNDFDEAAYAPFTWDLKRGAVGFMLAAEEEGGHGPKKQAKIVRHFVRGYIEGMSKFESDGGEMDQQIRFDNAPKLIQDLIEDCLKDRKKWLSKKYHDEYKRGFRADDEIIPLTSRRDEFQAIVDRFVRESVHQVPPRAGAMKVKDVAIRRGAGTASLGLARYYLMMEGVKADATDDFVIEFKQARLSALAGLVPPSDFAVDGQGERIAHAHGVQLVRGDVFYGHVEFEGRSFMSRERAPYRGDIDLDDLSMSQWKDYARICGSSLAHAHALSDEVGELDHDIEPEILKAMTPYELFIDDIVRFAQEASDNYRSDHQAFQADHRLGAFRTTDTIHR